MNTPTSAFAFCPVLDEMVVTGSAIGKSGKRIQTASISTTNNMLTLRKLHLELRAQRTLEIGLLFGGSCLVFAQTHKDLGAPPERQHVAIDPYQRHPFNDASGVLAMERAGLMAYLDLREEFSSRALPALLQEGRSFSIIYVDGSHNFEDVFLDMFYSAKLLETGGVVLFDDAQNPHVKKVLRYVRRNLRHCLDEMDLHPFHPESVKYRAAVALGRSQLSAFKKLGEIERPYGYALANF